MEAGSIRVSPRQPLVDRPRRGTVRQHRQQGNVMPDDSKAVAAQDAAHPARNDVQVEDHACALVLPAVGVDRPDQIVEHRGVVPFRIDPEGDDAGRSRGDLGQPDQADDAAADRADPDAIWRDPSRMGLRRRPRGQNRVWAAGIALRLCPGESTPWREPVFRSVPPNRQAVHESCRSSVRHGVLPSARVALPRHHPASISAPRQSGSYRDISVFSIQKVPEGA